MMLASVIVTSASATLVNTRATPRNGVSRPLVTNTFGLDVLETLGCGGPTLKWSTVKSRVHCLETVITTTCTNTDFSLIPKYKNNII